MQRITHTDRGNWMHAWCSAVRGLHTLTSLKHASRREVGKDRVNVVGSAATGNTERKRHGCNPLILHF